MCRHYLLLALVAPLAGCAGTQSLQAFTLRPPAPFVPRVTTPNVSADLDRSFEATLDMALRAQEEVDDREDMIAPMDEPPVKEGPRCLPDANESKVAELGFEPNLSALSAAAESSQKRLP